MTAGPSSRDRDEIFEAIERIVSEVAKAGGRLPLDASAERILRSYPGCDLGERGIRSQFLVAAALACVQVESGQRKGQRA